MKIKKLYLLYLLIFLLIFTFCEAPLSLGTGNDDDDNISNEIDNEAEFEKLINSIEDPILKQKLEEYKKSEMNKILDVKNVTPNMLVEEAETYLGTPYKFNGNNRNGIDCSGLIMNVFKNLGIEIERDAQEQSRYGDFIIDKNNLKKGDLVFFVNTYNTDKLITHTGIYTGDNDIMIHSSSSKGVEYTSISGVYWSDKFIFGKRIFR